MAHKVTFAEVMTWTITKIYIWNRVEVIRGLPFFGSHYVNKYIKKRWDL